MSAETVIDLGAFLRSRRAALDPEQVGLPTHGYRRVAGLRREELAELAGVSLTYYTRLEQGQAQNASDSVLDALARALRLSDIERVHLYALARPMAKHRAHHRRSFHVRPETLRLLDAMSDVPAVLMARNQDVLAWNRLGRALLAPHLDMSAPEDPDRRPNVIRMLFLDAATRAMYANWDSEAALAVASLRYVAAHFADDVGLSDLIGELCADSPEFATRWGYHPVQLCISGTKQLRHPVIGDLELSFEALHLPEAQGQRILTHTATPGSPDEDALRLLATYSISSPAAAADAAPQLTEDQ